MKKLLLLLVVILGLPVGAVLAFNAGLFQSQIESKVAQLTGTEGKLHLGPVRLGLGFPLKIEIGGTSIEKDLRVLEWEHLSVVLASLSKPYDLRVTLVKPVLNDRTPPAAAPSAGLPSSTPAPEARTSPPQIPPLRLSLTVEQGEIRTLQAQISHLDLRFSQKVLLAAVPATLHVKARLTVPQIPAPLDLALDTDSLTATLDAVKTTALRATIAGLVADVQGASFLSEGRHRWLLKIQAPDLSRTPEPPALVPAKNWKGAVELSAEVVKATAEADWQIEGHVSASQVSAVLNLKQNGVVAEGPFFLNLKSDFSYRGGKAALPSLVGQLDLSGARIQYKDVFTKAASVPLSLHVDIAGTNQSVQIKTLDVQLAQLKASATGTAELQSPWSSDLKIVVPPAALDGFESILLPLKNSPVHGQLALQAEIQGPLAEPRQCHILVPSLKLKNFAAAVDYDRPHVLQMRGPIRADLYGKFELKNGEVKSAEISGLARLKEAALVLGPLKKTNAQELSIDFSVLGSGSGGQNLIIKKFEIQSFVGRLTAHGTIENPLKPKLNLNISANPVNLTELRLAAPDFHDLLPKGEVRASLNLVGPLETDKPWAEWPLAITGEVNAVLPEYKIVSAPASEVPKPPPQGEKPLPAAKPAPTGFLPKGFLTSNAKVKIAVDIATVIKDQLVLKGVITRGLYSGGHFRGDVAIQKIFGGTVGVKALDVPLLEPRPMLQGTLSWNQLVIEEALAFAKPEYKEMASGRTVGRSEFATVLPSEPSFLKLLKARGEFSAQPVTLNSVKIGEMINDLLKKAPMLKLTPVKVEPWRGDMKGSFEVASEVATIPGFVANDVGGSELQMKGKVLLASMQGDLSGTFFWAGSPVKGCIAEGNSDDKQRLVVSLAIKGDLMKPGVSMLGDLFGKLAGRALECEKKKFVEKLKKDGTENLKKEAEKALKGLFGH